MTNIFAEGDTLIQCEDDNLIVQCQGQTSSVSVQQIETITEMSPCSTLGKFMDMRVVVLKSAGGAMVLIPLSRGGAHQVLKGIQQIRLQRAFGRPDPS